MVDSSNQDAAPPTLVVGRISRPQDSNAGAVSQDTPMIDLTADDAAADSQDAAGSEDGGPTAPMSFEDQVAAHAEELDPLRDAFNNLNVEWKTSPLREHIITTICESLGHRCGNCERLHVHFTSAVLLGLESLAPEGSSMKRLVVFLDVVEYLEQNSCCQRVEMNLYAQDPQFTEVDKIFLKGCDIRVVECPRAVHFITPGTFVYAPNVGLTSLLSGILPGRDPALYIGRRLNEVPEEFFDTDKNIFPAAKWMHEKYVGTAAVVLAKQPSTMLAIARGFL